MMMRTSVIVFMLGVLIGCGDSDEIRQYKVAKDKAAVVDPHAGHDHGPGEGHEDERPSDVAKPDATATDSPITYAVPEGWREEAAGGIRTASFSAGPQDKPATTTIIALGGPAGGVAANVNRWRGQIGLEQLEAAEVEKSFQKIEVDGNQAYYVDLAGAEQRVLGVILTRGERTWFIKMIGPSQLVGQEKERFEALTRSIKFK